MDESLAAFQALILQMYRKVKTMHELALDILRSGDKEKALQLIYMDDFVNHLEEEINDQAQTVLALLSPVATDLRKVIAGIKIASDLERIGDYAKNIADYVIKKGPAEPPFVGERAVVSGHAGRGNGRLSEGGRRAGVSDSPAGRTDQRSVCRAVRTD